MGDDLIPIDVELNTDDGERLEAEFVAPADPTGAVLLAHPHPEYGGSMRVPLIDALLAGVTTAGLAALRFNFRGVGRSSGTHDGGGNERLDVAAGLAELRTRVPDGPLIAAGWSFGGDVALAVADPAIAAWVGVAAPLMVLGPEERVAATDPRPKLLIVPDHDQFRRPAAARDATADWAETSITEVAGDHFLAGSEPAVATHLVDFASALTATTA